MLKTPTRTARKTLAALCVLSGTLLAHSAQAAGTGIAFSLDNNGILTITRPTTGTTTGSLLGTVTNNTGSPITLTTGNFTINGTFDSANDFLSPHFPAGFTQSLAASGGVFHGDLVDFKVTPTTPLGLYDLNGGTTAGNTFDLSLAGFSTIRQVYSVNVVPGTASAVPEPSSLAVLGLGAFGLAALVLRRKSVRA